MGQAGARRSVSTGARRSVSRRGGAIVASEGPERPARRGAGLNALLGLTDYAQEGFRGRAGALSAGAGGMAQAALQAPQTSARLRRLAAVGLLALSTSGCLTRSPETTGSLGDSAGTPAAGESWRTQSETWGRRFDANPGDVAAAINYARALRGLDQHAQPLAVLQQAAIRNPKHFGLRGAYGKALADVGRLKKAADVL